MAGIDWRQSSFPALFHLQIEVCLKLPVEILF